MSKPIGGKPPAEPQRRIGLKHQCCGACHRLEKRENGETLLLEPVRTPIILKRHEGSRHTLLRVAAHTDYQPGQFFQVTVLGFGEAPISIASYSKDHIDLIINPVGTVTREAVKLHPGDSLLLRGPFGYGYPMEYFYNNDLILVGGGCGVAPLKGVMDYIAQHRSRFKEVTCYFGYRDEHESIFRDEMRRWEKDGTFTFVYAYSAPPSGFTGNTGYVTQFLEGSGVTNHGKVVLICGPPGMMTGTIQTLKKMGFNDDQIWISHERHMKCATGMCGHCMIEGKYTCKDGPVFRWDWIKDAHG